MQPYYQDEWVTLYHGDCRDVLPGLCHDPLIVVTDPPWELNTSQIEIRGSGVAPSKQKSLTLKRGAVGLPDMEVIRALETVATHDLLVFAGYKELGAICGTVTLRGVFGWHKPNGAPAAFYPAKLDLSFIVWGGKKSLLYGFQHWPSMVFSHPFPQAGCFAVERYCDDTGKAVHPCQGPLSLYKELLRPFPADVTVLDAYCGTGTTLRAAKDCGRRSIGIEINEAYCEIIATRMAQEALPLGV